MATATLTIAALTMTWMGLLGVLFLAIGKIAENKFRKTYNGIAANFYEAIWLFSYAYSWPVIYIANKIQDKRDEAKQAREDYVKKKDEENAEHLKSLGLGDEEEE